MQPKNLKDKSLKEQSMDHNYSTEKNTRSFVKKNVYCFVHNTMFKKALFQNWYEKILNISFTSINTKKHIRRRKVFNI